VGISYTEVRRIVHVFVPVAAAANHRAYSDVEELVQVQTNPAIQHMFWEDVKQSQSQTGLGGLQKKDYNRNSDRIVRKCRSEVKGELGGGGMREELEEERMGQHSMVAIVQYHRLWGQKLHRHCSAVTEPKRVQG
jgi:hypothetical protein